MRYYFAPLEGLTNYIYRRVHHQFFSGITQYYTPFISPTVHRHLTQKEMRELPRADSLPFRVVPQLLGKVSEDFLWMTLQCKDLGYDEVNLNLGCPYGTVTAKGKGSGMLSDPDTLDRFLDEIYNRSTIPISIKTRIGFRDPEEFCKILDIYNQYPVKELTIHPRVRSAFYNGQPDLVAFRYGLEHSNCPVCYNGNLCSLSDIQTITQKFPNISAVMLGRGLIADPGMLSPGGTDVATLEAFLTELMEAYTQAFGGVRNAMFCMKEHWRYLLLKFEGSQKLGKMLRKTTDINEYKSITGQILHTLPLVKNITPDW